MCHARFALVASALLFLVACGGTAGSPATPAGMTAPTTTTSPTPTAAPKATAAPAATPRPVSSVATAIKSVTSHVGPGSNATVSVTTASSASCSITVTYNSGPSKASGLGPKTADSHGAVTWTWKVGSRTAAGTYPIDVECTPGGSAEAQFTVS
jgi:hypothetical protein